MRLRVWKCPKCSKIRITPSSIHGIGCKCGTILRRDTKAVRELVEIECKEKAEEYNTTIEYYKNKNTFVIPEQFKIKAKDLHRVLVYNADKYSFGDES